MKRTETSEGAKIRQRRDSEDRAISYRQWRHGRGGRSACVCDIDQLEYRYVDGVPVAIGILEITRIDTHSKEPAQGYFDKIDERYNIRDGQGKATIKWAEILKCEAWIVVFRNEIHEVGDGFFDHDFWLRRLSPPGKTWTGLSQNDYEKFLRALEKRKLGRVVTTMGAPKAETEKRDGFDDEIAKTGLNADPNRPEHKSETGDDPPKAEPLPAGFPDVEGGEPPEEDVPI